MINIYDNFLTEKEINHLLGKTLLCIETDEHQRNYNEDEKNEIFIFKRR